MKKMIFIACLFQTLYLGNAFSEETPSNIPVADRTSAIPPQPEPGSFNPNIQAIPKKEKHISPKVFDLRKKPHRIAPEVAHGHPANSNSSIKPALNIERPINHSVKQIKVVAVPHNENNVQKPQPRMIKPEMTIQSHKIPVDTKPHNIAAEPAPTTGPIQELHYNQTKPQESITGIDRNNPIGTNSTIHVAPRVKHQPKQFTQIIPRAQLPNYPPTQHVVPPNKQSIPVLAPKIMDTK